MKTLTIQRDYGNRSDRKLARLKYTLDKFGVDWFKEELQKRTGILLQPAKTFQFSSRKDHYGWQRIIWPVVYTLFVENVAWPMKAKKNKIALLKVAQTKKAKLPVHL